MAMATLENVSIADTNGACLSYVNISEVLFDTEFFFFGSSSQNVKRSW
jgi:hypothetical protein